MNTEQFWDVVANTRIGRDSIPRHHRVREQNRRYLEILRAMSPEEVCDYKRIFEERMRDAYRWDLWAAAYILGGGCSNDGFHQFRAWLISKGRDIYEATLRNPESLAECPELTVAGETSYDGFASMPWMIYKEKTGADMPDLGVKYPPRPRGVKFDEAEESLEHLLPKLFNKFWEDA